MWQNQLKKAQRVKTGKKKSEKLIKMHLKPRLISCHSASYSGPPI
jgi:hypothetical protein